nr:hypothetical protein [Mangrovicoccus sp. HB161399]
MDVISFVASGTASSDTLGICGDGAAPRSVPGGPDRVIPRLGGRLLFQHGRARLPCRASGNDSLRGGANNGWLLGGGGNDRLEGADRILGAVGGDKLWGGRNRDSLVGGIGNDSLYGGEADDRPKALLHKSGGFTS